MGHYKSNVRDLEFNLFEVLSLEKALATGEFGDLDGESVRQMLAEAAKLAEGPIAESFAETDRRPPTFDPDTHVVAIPEPFKQSLNAWRRGEWFRIGLDEGLDGVPAPAMLAWAINELPLGRGAVVGGLDIFAMFTAGALGAASARRLRPRTAMIAGASTLAVGIVLNVIGLHIASAPLYFVGTSVSGFGWGATFLGAMSIIGLIAPAEHWAASSPRRWS